MVGGSAKEELPGATLADIVPWLLGEVEDDRAVGRIRSGCRDGQGEREKSTEWKREVVIDDQDGINKTRRVLYKESLVLFVGSLEEQQTTSRDGVV